MEILHNELCVFILQQWFYSCDKLILKFFSLLIDMNPWKRVVFHSFDVLNYNSQNIFAFGWMESFHKRCYLYCSYCNHDFYCYTITWKLFFISGSFWIHWKKWFLMKMMYWIQSSKYFHFWLSNIIENRICLFFHSTTMINSSIYLYVNTNQFLKEIGFPQSWCDEYTFKSFWLSIEWKFFKRNYICMLHSATTILLLSQSYLEIIM